MRVLVTGGAGFVGSHVVEYYSKKGNDVILFDNLSRSEYTDLSRPKSTYNYQYIRKNCPDVKLVRGDITDFRSIKKVCKDVDVVIHTAAQVAVTTSVRYPMKDFAVNASGTLNLLEAVRMSRKDCSLIYCSTNKVYGTNINKIPVEEGDTRYNFEDVKYKDGIDESTSLDLCQHTPYGCSKLCGDMYVQDYGYTYGLRTGIFRMSCIYGERQFGTEDQGWVAWFVLASLKNKPITIYGDGKQVRDILYVSDLVNAYDSFLKSSLKNEVFNIGGGPNNNISLLELMRCLKESIGDISYSFSEWRLGDQKVYISDISKAKRLLGWNPMVNVSEGIKRLITWLRENA